MAVAQIAIPLTGTTAFLSSVTVVAMAVCAFGCAWRAWGSQAALTTLGVVGTIAFSVELLGSRMGFPFGSYAYTGALQPALGGVPLVVPVAWFAMGVASWATAAWVTWRRALRILIGACALTAWDLFLDPQMVRAGFWRWSPGDWWTFRGIPLVNFLGWFLTSLIVMALIEWLSGPARSTPLLGLYTWVAVMQTLGFLVFFGDPLVGLVGGVAMVPVAALGWWRWSRG